MMPKAQGPAASSLAAAEATPPGRGAWRQARAWTGFLVNLPRDGAVRKSEQAGLTWGPASPGTTLWTEVYHSHVPGGQRAVLCRRRSAAKRGFVRGTKLRSGDGPQVRPALGSGLRGRLCGEDRRSWAESPSCDLSVTFLNLSFWESGHL